MKNFNKAKENKDATFVGSITSGTFSGVIFILAYIVEFISRKKGLTEEIINEMEKDWK